MKESVNRVSSPKKNVLVAVAGQTPAIVTETLWALEQQRAIRVDEIRVMTTARGRRGIVGRLLGEGGQFERYCDDYGIPPGRIAFSESTLYTLTRRDGDELEDIRSSEDNMEAANQVFALVREWCNRKDEILHCSVAGGRKTLGIYLSMALMLCGRPEDTLSHVLVAPQFESGVPDFFYPPPQPRFYRRRTGFDSAGRPLFESVSSQEARVELAEIPFLRLREAIGGEIPLEKGLTDAIAHSELILNYLQAPPPLRLHLDQKRVTLGKFSFPLSRQLMAVYAFFLQNFNDRNADAALEDLFRKKLQIADLERRIDRLRRTEQERYAWETVRDPDEFRSKISPCITKINKAVQTALGKNRLSDRYTITQRGRYGIRVPKFEITETHQTPRNAPRQ